ncbi:MAG: nucleotidyl transferase AbiEii/AbiGii toxin family protein [Limisphaerales bacterium]
MADEEQLKRIAAKLIWWQPPEVSLKDVLRLVAQIMNLGTWEDVKFAQRYFGEAKFRDTLEHAQPGWFEKRSWALWHHAFSLPVPPAAASQVHGRRRAIELEGRMSFAPRLDILPAPQRALWPELKQVPGRFVLYGRTALALRIGHRQSVDFDFFCSEPFDPMKLFESLPFLSGGNVLNSEKNTLSVEIQRGGAVKVEFIGNLPWGRLQDPERTDDGVVQVASKFDVAGHKMAAIWTRSAARDYLDIYALLNDGMSLADMLATAAAIYGGQLNPAISLRALSDFSDGELAKLPDEVKTVLARAAGLTSLEHLPVFERLPDGISSAT